jgi:hypothetical protein
MMTRGLLAALFVVGASAVPAHAAEVEDDCTTDYARAVVEASPFIEPGDPNPYPIVEVYPNGTIAVHPQNIVPFAQTVVPAVQGLAGEIGPFVQAVPGLTVTYVDCVV